MHVPRSFQSVTQLRRSDPITRADSTAPEATYWRAVSSPYRNPQQAASMSKQNARRAPIRSWTKQAVLGNIMSGVTVATTIMPTSAASRPAISSARRAA
jgi:hypothetical protein